MSEPILYTRGDGLARLTLNRPARLNAFNADLARAWRDATTDAVGRDDVGAILIDAAGPAFCAGGDVIDMAQSMSGGQDITALAGVINEGIRALVESDVPVVVAAHGTTAGGGLGILLSGDYAVVGANSRLGSLYANIGLTPDLSVSAQLARAVGSDALCSSSCRTACSPARRPATGAWSPRSWRGGCRIHRRRRPRAC
ncbi:enoyl-CoA hydratase/isomerase family protein [Microbacterium sp. NIBRBAC000506063]|uniref:enoyl-CoA hydratase/isomerase family protein n=1 Tax=Microbacterium sp. NIBRBAC000506063 TaxID=2734618 RepID=UPI001CB6C855|nr:enoyl-CoA hydratase/isomerase family protein [Microbacterium sp. NIBRBAC000506063]